MNNEYTKFIGRFLTGGAAGAVSMFLVYPMDMSRVRLAADCGVGDKREFKNTVDVWKKIRQTDGIQGLFRGRFGISMGGIATYRALYFGLYENG